LVILALQAQHMSTMVMTSIAVCKFKEHVSGNNLRRRQKMCKYGSLHQLCMDTSVAAAAVAACSTETDTVQSTDMAPPCIPVEEVVVVAATF
jgi:hypothetical protein